RARDDSANYAVPIALLPEEGSSVATIHGTDMLRALMPAVSLIEPLQAELPLPVSFDEFARQLQRLRADYFDRIVRPLLDAAQGDSVLNGTGAAGLCNLLNGETCQCRRGGSISGSLVVNNPGTEELLTRLANGEGIAQTIAKVTVNRTPQSSVPQV